jgi:hypothetical protein
MPLARIDIPFDRPSDYGSAIGDVVYIAMKEMLRVPKDDRCAISGPKLKMRLLPT